MKLISDFVITLLKEWQKEDLPINILIGNKYYDIVDFYFDDAIHEYILELSDYGIDYETRADECIIFKINDFKR